ncbi:MAG TPA: hypothetical protein VK817_10765 [Trebonia sp.]|jgi:hypothetical protein|nr:hypothetical protein [Trebonia sp.]
MIEAAQFETVHIEAAHIEAVQTSASPAAIWVVVVVVVACLAFWLIAVNVASRDIPARRRQRLALMQSAAGGASVGAAEAGAARLAEVVPAAGEAEPTEPIGGTRVPASGAVRILGPEDEPVPGERPEPDWVPGERSGTDYVPGQRAGSTAPAQAGPGPRHAMPAQRTADADEPQHSAADDDRH